MGKLKKKDETSVDLPSLSALANALEFSEESGLAKSTIEWMSKMKKWLGDMKCVVAKDGDPTKFSKIKVGGVRFSAPAEVVIPSDIFSRIADDRRSPITLTMYIVYPKKDLHMQDYVNARYFDKRDAWIGHIKHHLIQGMKQGAVSGDERLKLAHVRLQSDIFGILKHVECTFENRQVCIRIIPTLDIRQFQNKRLKAGKQCMRFEHSSQEVLPSSHYNNLILREMRNLHHLGLLKRTCQSNAQFNSATRLIVHWTRTRMGLGLPDTSVPLISQDHIILLFAHFVLSSSAVLEQASSTQLLKFFFVSLANLKTGDFIFGVANPVEDDKQTIRLYDDSEKVYDILWDVGAALSELQANAQDAVQWMHGGAIDTVILNLFTYIARPMLQYDVTLQSNILDAFTCNGRIPSLDLMNCLSSALEKALTQTRLRHVAFRLWNRQGSPVLIAALKLRNQNKSLMNLFDEGPDVEGDSKLVQEYLSFWGQKTKMYRLPDSRTVHGIQWASPAPWKEHPFSDAEPATACSVPLQVLQYVCKINSLEKYKLSISPSWRLADCQKHLDDSKEMLDTLMNFTSALASSRSFSNDISEINMVSADARLSDLSFVHKTVWTNIKGEEVLQVNLGRRLTEGIILLGGTAGWPEDELTRKNLKLACMLKLRESIKDELDLDSSISHEGFIDVQVTSDRLLRLSLSTKQDFNPERSSLVNSALVSNAKRPHPDDKSVVHARECWWRVKHHKMMQHATSRFPLLTATIRLFKVFLSKRWGDWAEHDEFWELMVLSVFKTNQAESSLEPIDTPQAGVVRVLSVLANHSWKSSPVLAEIELSSEEKLTLLRAFNVYASAVGQPQFYVSTKIDPFSIFLRHPEPIYMRRLISFTRHMINRADGMVGLTTVFGITVEANLAEYDYILSLKAPSQVLQGQDSATRNRIKNLATPLRSKLKSFFEKAASDQIYLELGLSLKDAANSMLDALRTEWRGQVVFFRDPFAFPYAPKVGLILQSPSAFLNEDNLRASCKLHLAELFGDLRLAKKI